MAGLLQKWGLGVELKFGADEALRDMGRAQRGVQALQSAFGGLKEAGSRLAGGLGQFGLVLAPIAAGFGLAANKASGMAGDLEAQMLTMRVLLGDAGKAQGLIDKLVAEANATPFESGELIESSKRLLRLTGDNVDKNLEMLHVMETMAALNPTKTLTDSVEALLDASSGGGFERLKEFGIAFKAEDFAKTGRPGGQKWAEAVFKALKDRMQQLTKGEDLVASLGQTFQGRKSTFVDVFNNLLREVGKTINENVGQLFGPVGDFFTEQTPAIVAAFQGVSEAIRSGITRAQPYLAMVRSWWKELGGDGQKRLWSFVLGLGAFATIAVPIGGAIAGIVVAVSGLATAASALLPLLEAVAAALTPEVILPAVAAFGALTAAAGAFYTAFARGGEGPLAFLKRIGGGALDTVRRGFDFVAAAATTFWDAVWLGVGPAVAAAWAQLVPTIQALGNRLGMVWAALTGTQGPAVDWLTIIQLLGEAVGWLAAQGIGRLAEAGLWLANVFQTIIDLFQPIIAYVTLLLRMWGLLAAGQVTFGQAIGNAITVVIAGIVTLVATVINLLLTLVEGVLRAVSTVINGVPGAKKILGGASSLGADQVAEFRASISNDFAKAVAGSELQGQEAAKAKGDAASPTVNVATGPVKAEVAVNTSVQVDGKEIARAQGDQAVRSGERGKTKPMPAEQRGRVLRSGLTVTPLGMGEVL